MSSKKGQLHHHPNWYYHVPEMSLLILGTFPPLEGKRKIEFYYPNPTNRFWKTMEKLAQRPLTTSENANAVAERQELIKQLGVGLQNMGSVVRRLNPNRSDDRYLEIVEFQQNIVDLLRSAPNLKSVLLTGFSGKSSTYHWFLQLLQAHNISHDAPAKPKAHTKFSIYVGRPIHCWIGNSTSSLARKVKEESLIEQFQTAYEDSKRAA